jgi:hypothetical protein
VVLVHASYSTGIRSSRAYARDRRLIVALVQVGEPSLTRWTHAGADAGVSDGEYAQWFVTPTTGVLA